MSDYYIYSSQYEKQNEQDETVITSVTVIFCPSESINQVNLQNAIKVFYEANYQTDEIIVLGGKYNKTQLSDIIIKDQITTFKYIPKLEPVHLGETTRLLLFDKKGDLKPVNNDPTFYLKPVLRSVLNDGLVNIFNTRGGLIEAKGDSHHFVFPSGKHCDKFLRTGNVLMNTAEIYFIAFRLLSRLKDKHEKIYCDTSSINTLAFALLELKRRLSRTFRSIPIESFSSYDGLFSKSIRFFGNSLVLISSSTSGNIIDRIIEHDEDVDVDNTAIIFFLGSKINYKKRENTIICNLTKSEKNLNGIDFYDTYSEKECHLCASGSYPVEVKGDVFLLEKPKINRVTIKVTDAPRNLSTFVKQFTSEKQTHHNVFKVNYKETSKTDNKYEVYFDIFHVLDFIERNPTDKKYRAYREKLFDYINQYIPSNTKFLICLPDEGSIKLANMIKDYIAPNYLTDKLPKIVAFNDVVDEIKDVKVIGSAVIVGSCISNGKNLLYLSRAFRNFNKLTLVYFIGLARTGNNSHLQFLKSNLKQGDYGKETNSFVEVESFFCDKASKNTSWVGESKFLVDHLLEVAEQKSLFRAKSRIEERIELIDESLSTINKGLANKIFFPNTLGEELELRKGFAFIKFEKFEYVSQADVYFAISAILNNLRNVNDHSHCLKQSEFVRNIIDPGNFNRYNDGIIQASILRAAKQGELSYHIDEDLSEDMKSILDKVIEDYRAPQGEGLVEFLYALASKKMTLKKDHLEQLLKKVLVIEDELVQIFGIYISEIILKESPTLQQRIAKLEEENKELKSMIAEKPES